MQMIRIIFLAISIGLSFITNAQFIITGTVMDSTTREPLPKASVFCQNTTLGTVTDKQGEFSLSLKSGGYELIFSYTGYQTQTIRVTDNNKLEILLVKEDKSMGEVFLKNTYEVADGWDKYGDFFIKNFIGSTPNANQCVLANPEVLKFYFYKRTNRLKVLSTEPLQVFNKALGYNLRYQLDSFVYYYNTQINSYRGYCLYTEMEGDDSLKNVWTYNRKKAYEGSKLHFMRSYYDSTLLEDGWIIDMLDEKNDKKFNKVKNVYDTLYYGALDSTLEIEIWFPRKISITYTKKEPEPEYLKKMSLPKSTPYPISYIDLKETIAITQNGYYYEQKDWINQGYWSWKNIGDLLPYDYLPD
ncbi:MAG: carboxypeptidase-like regulatory domain-containing protein [Chitinophagaceae bacterium]|nr:carboxypeptidase-like regulatory domain-containing protein [Chitinophagaceae bacterium]MBL0271577.1 carboxypeptidase-like regulatory domain-containing protein [Chitinophagaceae bacterium]